jgi:uncharacterized protein (TIGR03083 family)
MTKQRVRSAVTLDRDAVWRAIDAHRLKLTDLLRQLTDDEWRHPSLCEGWTVRDVTAHLTLQHISVPTAIVEMVRARANMNRLIHDAACRRSSRPVDEMIAQIRGMVGSRRHPPGVTYLEALIDNLVHSQDITVPLGRRLDLAPEAAATAASRVWSLGGPFHARRKVAGFRLSATDIAWSVGDGPDVETPIDAILLVLTGRLVALPRLAGEGAAGLTAQLRSLAQGRPLPDGGA